MVAARYGRCSIGTGCGCFGGGDWNVAVEARCGQFIGITSGGGFEIKNTGTESVPAGTVFTWQQTVRITGISAWRIASRIWVDSGLLFPERNYGPIVNTSWSRWDRNDWNIGVRTDTKTRTVNITVPAGGFAPGETYFVGWTSLLMHSTFECEFIFTSSNPGTIEGDESVMFTPSPIIGCDVRNPDLADSTLLDSMNAEERAIVEEVARS